MTTLHDQLRDSVSDVTVDLPALTATARRAGTAQRRRRRAAAAGVGAAAVLAVGSLGLALLPPGSGPTGAQAPVTGSGGAGSGGAAPAGDGVVRLDGRIAAVIAQELVAAQVPTMVVNSSIRGQGGVDLVDSRGEVVVSADENADVHAEFRMLSRPEDSSFSTLGVDVQRWPGDGLPSGCADVTGAEDCTAELLPNGDLLRTYRDRTDKPGVTRLVAELVSASRGLRVVATSAAPTGAPHPLGLPGLAGVASDPVWAFDVPARFEPLGDALPAFTWVDSVPGAHVEDTVRPPEPDVG